MADTSGVSASSLWADYTRGKESSKLDGTKQASSELDKNAFLTLLITQMKYQDPLNPTEDKEFLAQMAQFTSLEQMQNMNKLTGQSQAFNLVGKTVMGTSYNAETMKYTDFEGRVANAVIKGGEAYLVVNGLEVKLSEVSRVSEDEYQMGLLETMNGNIFTQQALDLVGRTIQAITFNSAGEADGFVEGKVEYIRFTGSTPILVVGDKEVFPQEVVSVAEENMLIGKTVKAQVVIDGVYQIIEAEIDGVRINKDTAYIQLGGHEAQIDKIDKITEAIRWIGRAIKHTDVNGIADGVLVKSGIIYLTVGNKEVEFDAVRPNNSKTESNVPAAPADETPADDTPANEPETDEEP